MMVLHTHSVMPMAATQASRTRNGCSQSITRSTHTMHTSNPAAKALIATNMALTANH